MPTNERLDHLNQQTAAPIHAGVSPSLHPDMLTPVGNLLVDNQGGVGESIYIAGRTALRAIYSGLSAIETAHKANLEPLAHRGGVVKMVVPPTRATALADAMQSKFSATAGAVARAEQAVNESIAALEQKLANATSNPKKDQTSVAQAASEIRSYLARMKSSERAPFIERAISEGDIEVASAVLQATPYISGLDRNQQATLRTLAERKFAPREAAQRDAALKVRAQIEKAQQIFMGRYVELLPKVKASQADVTLRALKGAA